MADTKLTTLAIVAMLNEVNTWYAAAGAPLPLLPDRRFADYGAQSGDVKLSQAECDVPAPPPENSS